MSSSIVPGRTGRRNVAGLSARFVLVVLVVGVPVALSAFAGGPSIHLDAGGLWHSAMRHRPGDAQVVAGWLGRAAVLMAWIGWAWLTICVLIEARAWLTGRSTVRLPASRSLQWVAAVLVGTAFAVGTAGRAPVHHVTLNVIHGSPAHDARPAAAGAAEAAGTGAGIGPDNGTGPEVGIGAPPGRRSTPVRVEAVSQPVPSALSDSPAADQLGDGKPVSVAPSHGRSGSTAIGIAPPARHRVQPRETLWSVAESRLGEARRWREIADLNYALVQADGARLTADHWIQPGWELVLPSGSGTAPPGSPLVTRPVLPAPAPPPVATGAGLHRARAEQRPSGVLRSPIAPVAPIGAGIVGVGVADLVDRLRRVQQRHRGLGTRIRLPEQALRAVEQRLRAGGGRAELDAVEAALEACGAMFDPGGAPCRMQSVVVTGTHVRLTFEPAPGRETSAPFKLGSDPKTVEVERALLEFSTSRQRSARRRFPAPTLVTVGRTDDELLMVNLEGVGSLVLAGDPQSNESVGRAMALELATSRWSAGFDLVLIGFGAGMERCERVTVQTDAGPCSSDLSWRRLTTGMRLEELGMTRADAARALDGGAGWEPVVVVCGPGVGPGEVEALLAVGEDGRCGIGVVAICGSGVSQFEGSIVIRPDDAAPEGLTDVLGIPVVPQRLESEESTHVTAVVAAAAVLGDWSDYSSGAASEQPIDGAWNGNYEPPDDRGDQLIGAEYAAPIDAGWPGNGRNNVARSYVAPSERIAARIEIPTGARSEAPRHRSSDRGSPAHRAGQTANGQMSGGSAIEVEVAVLGPVEIRGAARAFTRAWATELVTYLAMHPGGASNETWATALWPERLMAPSSLHSTVSVARRSLGTAVDGSDHLPRSHGRLGLGPSVGTDWDRFQGLAVEDDPERWREALTLVRGRPFEGMRSTDWSILDGTAPAIESAVVDLSGRLAGARLRSGDPRGAEWSARRGLLVSPYDERLYRMLLRAADAAGNPGGVESVMAELVRVVADEIEPIESVHPSTLALYRSLSRRPRRVPGAPVNR